MKVEHFFSIHSEKDIFMTIKYIIICIILMTLISMAFYIIAFRALRNPANIEDLIFDQ